MEIITMSGALINFGNAFAPVNEAGINLASSLLSLLVRAIPYFIPVLVGFYVLKFLFKLTRGHFFGSSKSTIGNTRTVKPGVGPIKKYTSGNYIEETDQVGIFNMGTLKPRSIKSSRVRF